VRFSAAVTADRLLPAPLARHARPALSKLDGVLFAPDERGAASRMSLIAFAIRVASAALAFGSQVVLARVMGSFDYGVFVLVWTTVVIAGALSCLGFHTSVVRFVPEYRERGMAEELRGVVLASRLLTLVASTALTGIGLFAFWMLSERVEPFYVAPFLVGLLCVPMIALSDTLEGLARAQSWAVASLAPVYLVRPLLLLLIMLGAVWVG